MTMTFFAPFSSSAIPIHCVSAATWPKLRQKLSRHARASADAQGFEALSGRHFCVPSDAGGIEAVIWASEVHDDPFLIGKLVALLPAGTYYLPQPPSDHPSAWDDAALAWALSSYRFTKYKKSTASLPRLCLPKGCDHARVLACAEAIAFARDLINTPANDMGPDALEQAAQSIARKFKARARVVRGAQLLKQGFPLIHAVGRAADQPPRLFDMTWGPSSAPKVTLVGKGVCFDTGGLDIKPSSAMLLMKKDMAGAATALALASMIMAAKLNVRLRVLLPIVENAISAASFRPGDVCMSRKGISVEIGNTDAEGRLILADALTWADDDKPDLLCDFATLTGAARVALGPDLPPFFTDDEGLADAIMAHGHKVHDPVWRLPLWKPYAAMLDSKIAHTNNVSSGPFAGSITAALFLSRFVTQAKSWVHFDIYGWSPAARPARPEGGDPQTARLMFDLIASRYQKPSLSKQSSKPAVKRAAKPT
jgi:leucyl aminopeptidase